MFSNLPTPVLDPILSLSVAYRNDERPNKVDLGIGVYKNSAGENADHESHSNGSRCRC